MKCCTDKKEPDHKHDEPELVKCESCGMKIAKSVAAVMYLKGREYIFCSHECQDLWEIRHPGELW